MGEPANGCDVSVADGGGVGTCGDRVTTWVHRVGERDEVEWNVPCRLGRLRLLGGGLRPSCDSRRLPVRPSPGTTSPGTSGLGARYRRTAAVRQGDHGFASGSRSALAGTCAVGRSAAAVLSSLGCAGRRREAKGARPETVGLSVASTTGRPARRCGSRGPRAAERIRERIRPLGRITAADVNFWGACQGAGGASSSSSGGSGVGQGLGELGAPSLVRPAGCGARRRRRRRRRGVAGIGAGARSSSCRLDEIGSDGGGLQGLPPPGLRLRQPDSLTAWNRVQGPPSDVRLRTAGRRDWPAGTRPRSVSGVADVASAAPSRTSSRAPLPAGPGPWHQVVRTALGAARARQAVSPEIVRGLALGAVPGRAGAARARQQG